jgi:3-phenylpropionate/trans-cinnamate dioxygenase ferredoxin reductase subunit
MSENFVIIGAGQAGGQAAQSLRTAKFEGQIILLGEEPYAPYQRPPLSKKYLSGEMDIERVQFKPDRFYEQSEIDLRLNARATAIDRKNKSVSLEDGSTIQYDKLLLATGSRVRKLPIEGADLDGVFYLRTIEDVDGIRAALTPNAKLVIVGGGYIGLEVAAVAKGLGAAVTVLEMEERVLKRVVAPEVSTFFEKFHGDLGVRILTNTAIDSIKGADKVTSVICADGREIDADVVIVGVGILPNQEIAADAGLDVDNGIVVDEGAMTSDPDIFAAGDCTNHPNALIGRRIRLESVQNAIDQAKAAASGMMGEPKVYTEVPWFWSDQADVKLQIAGLSQGHDQAVVRGDPDDKSFATFYLKEGAVIAVDAINAVPEFMIGKRLIAANAKVPVETLTDMSISMKEIMKMTA